MVNQYTFYFDSAYCSGCKACQVACKDKHNLEVGRLWRRVYEVEGGDWQRIGDAWIPNVFAYYLSMACNHCQQPICQEVCPSKAIYKRKDGIVLIQENRCIGCSYCSWACPYGALQYDAKKGKMTKCTLCYDEIDMGRAPICVASCPMRVLEYGEDTEFGEKDDQGAEVFPLPNATLTGPAILITPHKDAMRADSEYSKIANREEVRTTPTEKGSSVKEWAMILFTIFSQMAVGAFLVLGIVDLFHISYYKDTQFEGLILATSFVVCAIMVFSLFVSLLHLGTPLQAYRAITNIRYSWLSREISFAILFFMAVGVSTLLKLMAVYSENYYSVVFYLAVIFGCLLIYSMSRIYMLRTVPGWNTILTPISFLITTLVLGGFVVVIVFSFMHTGWSPSKILVNVLNTVRTGLILFTAGGVILAVVRFLFLSRAFAAIDDNHKLFNDFRRIFNVRLIAGILGSTSLTLIILHTNFNHNQYLISFALLLSAELFDRALFYRIVSFRGM